MYLSKSQVSPLLGGERLKPAILHIFDALPCCRGGSPKLRFLWMPNVDSCWSLYDFQKYYIPPLGRYRASLAQSLGLYDAHIFGVTAPYHWLALRVGRIPPPPAQKPGAEGAGKNF